MTRHSIIARSVCGINACSISTRLTRTRPNSAEDRDFTADLIKLLSSANVCSKRWVYEQYDSMVQTNTVIGPGGEGGVMRIKATGSKDEQGVRHERGLSMALDGNGRWAYLESQAWRHACRG